jgi:hypothetical protein
MGNKLHAVRGCNHVRVGKLSTNICYAKSWFVRSNADADANAGVGVAAATAPPPPLPLPAVSASDSAV